MILTCEERQVVYDEIHFLPHKEVLDPYLKAQLKKAHDKIESMVADGWFLEDILKALLEEIKE